MFVYSLCTLCGQSAWKWSSWWKIWRKDDGNERVEVKIPIFIQGRRRRSNVEHHEAHTVLICVNVRLLFFARLHAKKHACILVHLHQPEPRRVNTFSRVTRLFANIISPLALLLIPIFCLLFRSSAVEWSYDGKLQSLDINPPYNPLQLARTIRSNVRRG